MKYKMGQYKKLCIAIVFVLLNMIPFPGKAVDQVSIQPVSLRCEYLENPTGIDTPHPRFSWKLRGIAGERNLKQKAWEIRVASKKSLLVDGKANMWTSGRVSSSRTTQVVYGGKQLKAGETYYWSIRAWDQNGDVSEWSSIAQFTMGLLQPADWQAEWIGITNADSIRQNPWFRKSFTLKEKPEEAFER